MDWKDYKREFLSDGIPGKVSINHTRLQDWQSLVDYLIKTDASLEYLVNDHTEGLPRYLGENHFCQDGFCMLSIYLDDIQIECRFLDITNIILMFNPEDIDNELKAKVIFRLMSTVGRALNKPVVLYKDQLSRQPVFTYQPGSGLEYHGQD